MGKLLTTFFISFISLIHSQEKFHKPITIPFTLTESGHIVITAQVNGVDGTFIFDTGAGLNLLTKDFADKVKDLQKTHHFHTGHRATGEEIQAELWNSKSMKLGGFSINKEVFAVLDIDFPLDGLISLTPFVDNQLTIDFGNKMLTIESPESLKEIMENKDFQMPILISNDKNITIEIATYVNLENKLPLLVNLDSGAGFGVFRFNSRYLSALGIDSSKLKREFRKSSFNPESGNRFYFTSLSNLTDINNNTSVEDPKVSFIEGLIYEGIMGIDWIGRKITIDIPNKRLLVRQYGPN